MSEPHPKITIDLVLDRHLTKDVLRAILHSILFHRLFGTVKPKTFEVLDVTMPGVADPGMESLVDEKVDAFWRGVDTGASKSGQIIVTFSEKKQKKTTWFQVYAGEEEVPWEQWIISAEIRQPKSDQDRQAFDANLTATLTSSLRTMLKHTSSERGRMAVPLITEAQSISPFPIKMVVKVGGVEVG